MKTSGATSPSWIISKLNFILSSVRTSLKKL